jgi:predicted DNA-binding antitoxin AbrB/MazE fold protein
MAITIEAIYENGVLKPAQPLPLREHEKVRVSIHTPADVQRAPEAVRGGYGMIQWTGSLAELDFLIESADNDPLEGP